jgi:RecA/RadA recombinase
MRGVDGRRTKGEETLMSAAAALLDRLGRPGRVRLGTANPPAPSRLPTGLGPLDAALGGGLPRGRITELAGACSTGRTGLACAIAGRTTRAGETIAWVDPEDALDPEAAAAAGIDLARTLWVRPRHAADALRATEILMRAGGFGLVVLDLGSINTRASRDDGGRPRERSFWPTGSGGIGAAQRAQRASSARAPRYLKLAHAAEQTRTALLVIAPERQAGTFAALGLELVARRVRWSGGAGRLVLLDGIDARVVVARNRIGRPGQAVVVRQACA